MFTSLAAVKLLAAFLAIAAFPPFEVHPGKTDSDGVPTSNATLCVVGEEPCFPLFTYKEPKSNFEYHFGLKPAAEQVAVRSGGSLILFSGTYNAGGSASLTRLALVEYGTGGRLTNLLPDVYITEQGERKVWDLPDVSNMPVLLTAEANWVPSVEETRLAPHLFGITAYVFDSKTGKYAKRLEYVTAKKYPSLDDVDVINVLEPERATILQKLKAR